MGGTSLRRAEGFCEIAFYSRSTVSVLRDPWDDPPPGCSAPPPPHQQRQLRFESGVTGAEHQCEPFPKNYSQRTRL